MNKSIAILVLIFFTLTAHSQSSNNLLEGGISIALLKYNSEGVAVVNEKYISQTPRLNLTYNFTGNLFLDAAFSFNVIPDTEIFIKNEIDYSTAELNLRYNFLNQRNPIKPYILVGGSLIQGIKSDMAFNVGSGVTYWMSDNYGVNAQIMFKQLLEESLTQASHTYFSFGLVIRLKSGYIWGRR